MNNNSTKPARIARNGQKAGYSVAGDDKDLDNVNENGLQQVTKKEPTSIVALKLLAIFSTLYFFMWSSGLLSQAFNLASYHYAGNFIRTSGFLQNPLIGLMVGVITTVVFQSSGAVTSVLVTIVGSGVLTVRQSIPIIMGANLGTSVTNTVVSLIVYRKKQNFEIAMTAGIVHDMYNMMSVVFMLPIELLFHPLERMSMWMLGWFGSTSRTAAEIGQVQFLSHLVKPLVDLIIVIDKDKTASLDPNVIVPSNVSLIRRCCNEERIGSELVCHARCVSLFSYLEFDDNVVCILLLIMAMVTLFTCLIFVVKVTKSLLGGKLLNWVANLARREYKFPCSMFVGYLFIVVGLVITVILHSSGVFTSMLVPLAGGDVLNLMQIYELTLGSNVGTTTTGIFAALSAQSKYPIETLQVALCHFLFNVAGILMFYSFPHTTLPIWASKKFGMYSAQNLWFSIIYLIIVFLVAPSITMAIYLLTT